jgi:4-methyl-5(b-hydroxyethyl)-thiazole monophosphate biosynthesis
MVYVLLAEGFEELEALAPVDLLRRVDIDVETVSLTDDLMVQGGHNISVKADITLEQVDFDSMEMLVLPGGLGGVNTIANTPAAMELIQKVLNAEKKLAAICAAPKLLAELGILNGMSVVCHPSVNNIVMNAGGRVLFNKQATCDKNLITGKAAGSSIEFALELVVAMRDREAADKLRHALT